MTGEGSDTAHRAAVARSTGTERSMGKIILGAAVLTLAGAAVLLFKLARMLKEAFEESDRSGQ